MIPRLAALAIAATLVAGCERPVERPDVLVITLDTTRADRMGFLGSKAGVTPHLDALAAKSVVFENAVSQAPVTLPSHTTMFTGLLPFRHGVRYNAIHPVKPELETLAERFHDAGYATAAIVSSFAVAKRFGLGQGFDRYDDGFLGADGASRHKERKAGEAVDLAAAWWKEQTGRPRFLWVHLYDPHFEYAPPFPQSAAYANRPYEGEIAYMDQELGRLVATLEADGSWPRTLVVVAADHGEGLYDHGERWHSDLIFESTQHVPLLVKRAGKPKPRRIAEPVGLVDLKPTILELAGLPPGDTPKDGVSLAAAVVDGTPPPSRAIYFEAMGGNINFGWSPYFGLRSGRWKYTEGARASLFDLATDPTESDDVAAREPDRVADLRLALDAFRADAIGGSESGAPKLDEEAKAMLRSLGYLGGSGGAVSGDLKGPHPPDMVAIEVDFHVVQEQIAAERWEDAATTLDFILRKDPTNRYALFNRVDVLLRQGRAAEAVTTAQAYVKLYGSGTEGPDLLGYALARAGRAAEGARVYAEALAKHPDDARLRFRRVLCLVEAKRLGEVADEVAELRRRNPSEAATSVATAILEASRGETAKALAELGTAVDRGFRDLPAIEGAPILAAVRRDPAFAALRARIATPLR